MPTRPGSLQSDGNGQVMVERMRHSLRTMRSRAQAILDDIECALFSMRRGAQPR